MTDEIGKLIISLMIKKSVVVKGKTPAINANKHCNKVLNGEPVLIKKADAPGEVNPYYTKCISSSESNNFFEDKALMNDISELNLDK